MPHILADNLLKRLRGRYFTRLDDQFVEVFIRDECFDCNAPIALDSIILKETDEHLELSGLYRAVKPETGIKLTHGEPGRCRECHRRWLDPYRGLRAGEQGEVITHV